jgi:hypothetical protein
MGLYKIRDGYEGGKISKSEYIDQMHEAHKNLFEYAEFIKNTDIGNIEITDGIITMTSRAAGIRMVCDTRDKRVAPVEILNFKEYERTELDMMLRLICPGFIVFDIGANIGWYSMNLAKRVNNLKVHAFEPILQTFRYLERNLEINSLTNIKTYNFGFYNQAENLTFYFYPEGSVNASAANVRLMVQEKRTVA